jgi:hypothetical protein
MSRYLVKFQKDGKTVYGIYVDLTKVNKKSVAIEWRGFSLDRWVDQHFGYSGTYPRQMIERFCPVTALPKMFR